MQPIDLSLVVVMTPKRVIGRDNVLPWHLPSDLRRFKEITTKAGVIVMGHTTYDSIVARNGSLLPERHHIVLSRSFSLLPTDESESVTSVQEALVAVEKWGGRACVIGGGQIYKLFLPFVRTAFITTVHESIAGDTYFPDEIRPSSWYCSDVSEVQKWDPEDEYPTSFRIYKRIHY